MSRDWTPPPGHVSLDDVGLGGAYVLGAGQGQHSPANGSLRTLLARAADTHGDVSVMVCSGDESRPTMPHFHRHTTEAVFVLEGVIRIWLDDQNGTRFTRDLKAGEFGMLPRNWIHAWAFAAPNSTQFGIIAPGGFEHIVDFLDPDKPTSIERLRESEKHIDVRWLPDYPLFDLAREATTIGGV
ncbi:MAG TPA: cupin domain-containing protein [Amycolatopsis sp.]|uniref:cupin domain-containing protein n=1 Tax=Amycolatopsis sp. TaxID=37632 RepID=UPI002B477A46|nr:cupin domain-containing protein [Amycolatopsis sp.]HKS45844.1 cupin domain-containing protein [Amycolatopsis sp.]